MLIGGLMIHGINAGPLLLTNHPELVYCFFGVLLVGAVLVLLLQFFGMRSFPYILKTPANYLYTAIFMICTVGAYSDTKTMFNCWLMLIMGVVGIIMAVGNLPASPFILAYILGTMLETNMRKGLTYTDQGFLVFLTRPVSLILLLIAFFSLAWPFIRDYRDKKRLAAGKLSDTEKMAQNYQAKGEDD